MGLWSSVLKPVGKAIGSTALDVLGIDIQNKRNQKRAYETWKKQQEYNTPQNQMNRLRQAGINPHLAFSSGISNVATSPPETAMGSIAPNVMGDMSMAKGMEKTDADIDLTQAKVATEEWNTRNTEAKAIFQELTNTVEMGAFGVRHNPRAQFTNQTLDLIKYYGKRLRQARFAEHEARRYVANMETRLAEGNMTPGDNLYLKIAIEIFERMGFDIPNN